MENFYKLFFIYFNENEIIVANGSIQQYAIFYHNVFKKNVSLIYISKKENIKGKGNDTTTNNKCDKYSNSSFYHDKGYYILCQFFDRGNLKKGIFNLFHSFWLEKTRTIIEDDKYPQNSTLIQNMASDRPTKGP